MPSKISRTLLVAIICGLLLPATSWTGPAAYSECQVCEGRWNYDTNRPTIGCGTPNDGEWGSASCYTECFPLMDTEICTCDDTRNMCLYIVVEVN